MGYLPLLFLGRCVVAVGQLVAPMVGCITVRRKMTGKREILRILIDTGHCRADLMMEVYQMTLLCVLRCVGLSWGLGASFAAVLMIYGMYGAAQAFWSFFVGGSSPIERKKCGESKRHKKNQKDYLVTP